MDAVLSSLAAIGTGVVGLTLLRLALIRRDVERAQRAAERCIERGAALRPGVTRVRGEVRTIDEGPAVRISVRQEISERPGVLAPRHRFVEVGRECRVKPFWLELADGQSVWVEPPPLVALAAPLSVPRRPLETPRSRVARLRCGDRVSVPGTLARELTPARQPVGYRDGAMEGWVLRPAARAWLETDAASEARVALSAFYRRWWTGIAVGTPTLLGVAWCLRQMSEGVAHAFVAAALASVLVLYASFRAERSEVWPWWGRPSVDERATGRPVPRRAAPDARGPQAILAPRGLWATRDPDGLTIRYATSRLAAYLLLAMFVLSALMSLCWPAMIAHTQPWRSLAYLVAVLFVAFVGYSALHAFVNETVLRVDADRVTQRSQPLPSLAGFEIARTEIRAVRLSAAYYANDNGESATPTWHVQLVTRTTKLVYGSGNEAQARFVATELARALALPPPA